MEKRGLMNVAVDAVVFSILNNDLKILLIQRKNSPYEGMYALPGGFVNKDEDIEDAAKRELLEETGVKNIFLKQLGAYGDVKRDPRGRVISISFIAIIKYEARIKASTDAKETKWFSMGSLPRLAFDHDKIIKDALQLLKFEIQTTNIAFQILPVRFALSDLQNLYELILEKPLDKRNFRKKVIELGILHETNEIKMEGAHRPARLYSFANKNYTNLKDKIHVLLK